MLYWDYYLLDSLVQINLNGKNQFLVRIERISISSLTGEKFTGHCVSIISDIPQIEGNLKITIFLHIIKYMNTLD